MVRVGETDEEVIAVLLGVYLAIKLVRRFLYGQVFDQFLHAGTNRMKNG